MSPMSESERSIDSGVPPAPATRMIHHAEAKETQ